MNASSDNAATLIIIDDIKSVVAGLTAIDWAAHGIEPAGVASNGEDGLALAGRVKPDIVITDIRMPRMDGLSMFKALLERGQACKVILITGYADFEYAKQAVQLGAFDFVVKPFTEEEIVDAVRRAKQQVESERTRFLGQKEMERKVRESMPLLRQEYFSLLVHHRTAWENAAKRWAFLGIELAPSGFTVMLLKIDGFPERVAGMSVREIELIRFSLQNIAEETIGKHARTVVFRAGDDRFAAVLNDPQLFSADEIAERCCQNIERYTKFTVSVGTGGRVASVHELPDSYRQAESALAYHLFTGGNGAIGYDSLPNAGLQEPLALGSQDELLLLLRSGSGDRAAAMLDELAQSLLAMKPQPNPDYLRSLYEELAAAAIRTLYELVPQAELQPLVDRYKAHRIAPGATLADLQQQLLRLCAGGAELVRSHTLSEGQAVVYRSIEHMKTLLDRNVTVGECAAHVHLSVSYYSSLFKRVTGMTFTQYVTNEKIAKAKSLILSGKPVQDVAAEVGYEERRYFSETFKKVTGMTPSEFRDSYQGEGKKQERQ
ncbi:response regulator [Cohnella sp. JJ-181]|uniref:response regulator n=1 Tax=Cohnella rhizoplanae TaxID=2974897 RepID=UPI0022FFA77D|nr:response regulator [Cohnella sp. JJ-181]CAI6037283.1 Protein-glutamate methylesterase/protein-glutamine glutaminase [Cohnella sp. JJ-181]